MLSVYGITNSGLFFSIYSLRLKRGRKKEWQNVQVQLVSILQQSAAQIRKLLAINKLIKSIIMPEPGKENCQPVSEQS